MSLHMDFFFGRHPLASYLCSDVFQIFQSKTQRLIVKSYIIFKDWKTNMFPLILVKMKWENRPRKNLLISVLLHQTHQSHMVTISKYIGKFRVRFGQLSQGLVQYVVLLLGQSVYLGQKFGLVYHKSLVSTYCIFDLDHRVEKQKTTLWSN